MTERRPDEEKPLTELLFEDKSLPDEEVELLSDQEKADLRAMLYNQRARPAPETGGLER